jgi:acetolactate synthase I/II/III large subunit
MTQATQITVGDLISYFLERCGVKAAFGVISIHNMPILDAFHRHQSVRFVPARGEAGACNMADAYARATGRLGVCVTSTGTGAGNAAGAMIEALTAGTPLLHLTGQIESAYLDRNLGFIHEAPAQLAMLKAVGKAAFRITHAEHALEVLREAVYLACSAPCGPVSIEIPIDVQGSFLDRPEDVSPLAIAPRVPAQSEIAELAQCLSRARRPMLWVGGGARHAGAQIKRLVALGFGVVTSVQGRGVIAEDHPASLAAFNLQKPVEAFYASCDAMLVVGSRLRSNETLSYQLTLPKPLYRVDVDQAADQRAYANDLFICGDAALVLEALADQLEILRGHGTSIAEFIDPAFASDLCAARALAEEQVDTGLGPYLALKDELKRQVPNGVFWVRDITLSNTMWGNRSYFLDDPRAGIHALGGGIGQGLAMAVGAAIACAEHCLDRKVLALIGDGGFMLNPGELACAVQERSDLIMLVMNDGGYGVIKNIQDAVYGSRHCYVDLHTPDFSWLCKSMGAAHFKIDDLAQFKAGLAQALTMRGPIMLEIDMTCWGPFVAKFAGPPKK